MADSPSLQVSLDASGLRTEMQSIETLARGMGSALTAAFRDAALEGGSLGEVLRGLASRISDLALSAALRPVDTFFSGVFRSALGGSSTAFTSGGLAAPTYLRPPAAADLAQRRGPAPSPSADTVGTNSGGPVHVTVNIATPDLESFRRSEAQVTATLARAVARGRRGL